MAIKRIHETFDVGRTRGRKSERDPKDEERGELNPSVEEKCFIISANISQDAKVNCVFHIYFSRKLDFLGFIPDSNVWLCVSWSLLIR